MAHFATDWVERNARLYPHAPALADVDLDVSLTWAGLEERVARLSGGMATELRVGSGDRVVVLANSDTRCFEVQFACMRLGAIFVPLNWRLSPRELLALVEDADPVLVVHDDAYADTASELAWASGVPMLSWRVPGARTDLDELIDRSAPRAASLSPDLDAPIQILYTSGTTGRPKGALLSRANIVWQAANTAVVAALGGPGNTQLNAMPLFHVGGLNALANPLLMLGGCVAVARRFDPDQIASLLGDPTRGFTHFAAVPAMYAAVVAAGGFAKADLSLVRHAMVGAGFAPPGLVDAMAAKAVALQPHYGSTESGPSVTAMPAAYATRKVGTVGQPVLHTAVRVVDINGRDVEPGAVGEVWASGPSISQGYWRRDRASDPTFAGRWYRSGDAAVVDDEGFFTIVDRYKDMYKSGGENVFPAEVEQLLIEHPAIADVAVIGVADERWGEVGHAIVVVEPGHDVTLDELEAFCHGRLARFKVPRAVVIVDELPRTATGKLQKHLLRERASSDPLA